MDISAGTKTAIELWIFLMRRFLERIHWFAPEPAKDVEGSSIGAINRRRRKVGRELQAKVFRYAEERWLIASVMSSDGGPSVEVGETTVLSVGVSDRELGQAICGKLLEYEVGELPDQRDWRLSDWPAYKASGARSLRRFVADSQAVYVSTMNSQIRFEAGPVEGEFKSVFVAGSCIAVHDNVGRVCRGVFDGAELLGAVRVS